MRSRAEGQIYLSYTNVCQAAFQFERANGGHLMKSTSYGCITVEPILKRSYNSWLPEK